MMATVTLEKLLKDHAQVLAHYVGHLSRAVVLVLDPAGVILDCNQGLLALLDLTHKPVGRRLDEFLAPDEAHDLDLPSMDRLQPVRLAFEVRKDAPAQVFTGHAFNTGTEHLVFAERLVTATGRAAAKFVALSHQVNSLTQELARRSVDLEKAQATISVLMNVDPLTGLANRRAFMEALDKGISFARRHKLPLSVVVGDLDQFKAINEAHGQEGGDVALATLANTLLEQIRNEDVASRYGGAVFAVMLPNTVGQFAGVVAERIRQDFERLIIPKLQTHVTASFGVAELASADTGDTLVRKAEDSLRDAKKAGRNCVVVRGQGSGAQG